MRSRIVLFTHTFLFTSFVIGSPFVSVLLLRGQAPVSGQVIVIGASALAIAVVSSWQKYGGCPFTIWENQYRRHEKRSTYRKACIDHYALEWLGIRLPPKASTIFLVVLFLFPIAAATLSW